MKKSDDIKELLHIRKRIIQLKSPKIRSVYQLADKFLTLYIIRNEGIYIDSKNKMKRFGILPPPHQENILRKLRRKTNE